MGLEFTHQRLVSNVKTNIYILSCFNSIRFDTLQGIRGELNLQVRLQFFGDMNPFKDSSAGVQFYSSETLPSHLKISAVLGFVSVLENEDDPEYVINFSPVSAHLHY